MGWEELIYVSLHQDRVQMINWLSRMSKYDLDELHYYLLNDYAHWLDFMEGTGSAAAYNNSRDSVVDLVTKLGGSPIWAGEIDLLYFPHK